MTDEEMAEGYAFEKWPDYPEKQEIAEQAFLAGLNEALNIKDASDKRLEPILYKLKDLGVIESWYKNDTYHAC